MPQETWNTPVRAAAVPEGRRAPPAASMKMAHALRYQGAGMFEYPMNAPTGQWVFLAINPRVQVKHAVKRAFLLAQAITNLNIMRIQLLLSSATLVSLASLVPLDLTLVTVEPLKTASSNCTHRRRPAKDLRISPSAILLSSIL
ncbi:hypothetical protein FIBSPDRAFT_957096 [Athelia psychrophila]|uniref:Carbamoyl phosphate synthase ATP-binding domain-containing protein n=1 Tax=Athelia psychrophila TaxID=1759441 RepID=A0A166G4R1_9AGAM|nr:hypothetical protein FIBSPDRAFT_957096 [Fibularhizoctonia sp. CBS 109695]